MADLNASRGLFIRLPFATFCTDAKSVLISSIAFNFLYRSSLCSSCGCGVSVAQCEHSVCSAFKNTRAEHLYLLRSTHRKRFPPFTSLAIEYRCFSSWTYKKRPFVRSHMTKEKVSLLFSILYTYDMHTSKAKQVLVTVTNAVCKQVSNCQNSRTLCIIQCML